MAIEMCPSAEIPGPFLACRTGLGNGDVAAARGRSRTRRILHASLVHWPATEGSPPIGRTPRPAPVTVAAALGSPPPGPAVSETTPRGEPTGWVSESHSAAGSLLLLSSLARASRRPVEHERAPQKSDRIVSLCEFPSGAARDGDSRGVFVCPRGTARGRLCRRRRRRGLLPGEVRR